MSIFSQTQYKTNPSIFSRKQLEAKARAFRLDNYPDIEDKKTKLGQWIKGIKDGSIKSKKEESVANDFLNLIFGDVLDYEYAAGLEQYNLEKQLKNQSDSKKSDGALGWFEPKGNTNDVRAVIELKDAQTDLDKPQNRKNDHRTPIQQAFDYASDAGGDCRWVIVSNFLEIRLYNYRDRSKYELFFIEELLDDSVELQRFFFLLHKNQLLYRHENSYIDKLYTERLIEEKTISNRFYAEYKVLRLELFNNLRELNKKIHPLELLSKTQRLLDRIIFVCFCEDAIPALIRDTTIKKMIERAKDQPFDTRNDILWLNTKGLFDAMDKGNAKLDIQAFNGGLFAKDELLENLKISEILLEKALKLYEWDFESDLNVNILGHIFEQSISDLEELQSEITQQLQKETNAATEAKATSTDKKSKKKKDGVFYTPEFVTRYMVEETVGAWMQEQKEELGFDQLSELSIEDYNQIRPASKDVKAKKAIDDKFRPHREYWLAYQARLSKIKVLDPACGSGAFLVQVFDYLYKEHLIVNKELEKLLPELRTDIFEVQKQILTQNLYGVDLNAESVEITKLSLWIKTANKQKPLSTIENNIRCGNSLISDPTLAGEKAFDWHATFPEIFEQGGFDVVIGNPPYVRQELLTEIKPYLENNYRVFLGTADLYVYFFEKAISLLKTPGYVCFIAPNKFIQANYGKKLREFLGNYSILQIIDFGELPVFTDAATFPAIYQIHKNGGLSATKFAKIPHLNFEYLNEVVKENAIYLEEGSLNNNSWFLGSAKEFALFQKIQSKGITLKEYVTDEIKYGIKTGFNEAFIIDSETRDELIKQDVNADEIIKPFIDGDDVRKYRINSKGKYIILTKIGTDIKRYKSVYNHLLKFQQQLETRWDKGNHWWELRACDYYDYFDNPKIIYPEIALESRFTIDVENIYTNKTVFLIPQNDLALLALLNSKVVWYFLKKTCTTMGDPDKRGRLNLQKIYVEKIPIIQDEVFKNKVEPLVSSILENNKEEQKLEDYFLKALHASFIIQDNSNKIRNWHQYDFKSIASELKKQKVEIPLKKIPEWSDLFNETQQKIKLIQAKIANTDREIDQLVYQLYQLSPEEIEVVEGNN